MSSRASNKLEIVNKEGNENTNNNQLVKKKTRRHRGKKTKKPENDVLFFKIWRNKVLYNEIYSRAKLISEIRMNETKFTVKSLQEYNHRNYLKKVILINDKNNIPDLSNPLSLPTPLSLPLGLIPPLTECLDLKNYCSINQGDIPEGVVNIKFGKAFRNIDFSHIPKSIQKIQFSPLTRVIIPDDGNGLEEYCNLEFIAIDIGSLDLLNHSNRFPKLKTICINGSDGRNLVIQEGVVILIFGSAFNSKLPSAFPQSLKCINIGIEFTKPFNLQALPPNIEDISIRSYHIRNRFNEFSIFKKLKILQYYSGRPHDKLDGMVVSESHPNLIHVISNNMHKFKNNQGTLVLEKTFQNLTRLTQQQPVQTQITEQQH